MPKTEDQFKEFFTNATNWITARGEKITEVIGMKVKRESGTGLRI